MPKSSAQERHHKSHNLKEESRINFININLDISSNNPNPRDYDINITTILWPMTHRLRVISGPRTKMVRGFSLKNSMIRIRTMDGKLSGHPGWPILGPVILGPVIMVMTGPSQRWDPGSRTLLVRINRLYGIIRFPTFKNVS